MVAALLFAGMGCKRSKKAPAVDKDVEEAAAFVPPKVESSPAEIKLLDAGKAPRQPLRYKLVAGQKETAALSMDIAIQMKDGEIDMPVVRFPLINLGIALEVKEVSPEAEARYDFTFTTASIDDRGDVSMGVYMDPQIKALVGVGGTTVVTSRGVTKSLEIRTPDAVDDKAKQLIDSLKQSAAHFAPALPEEEVGVGATWIETATVVADGMKVVKTTNYKLVSLEKGVARLEVTSQHVGDASQYAPHVPAGSRVELKEYSGTVTGEVTLELAHVLAISKQKSSTVVEVFVSTPEEDKNVRTTTTQEMTVADVKVELPPSPPKAEATPPKPR